MRGQLIIECKLAGSISPMQRLFGSLHKENNLQAELKKQNSLFGVITRLEGYEDYTGIYELTPTVSGFSIDTDSRLMIHDVIVNPIPYFEVDNEQGGTTAIIGG